jgi:glutaminyl-peptide cyclotransferase
MRSAKTRLTTGVALSLMTAFGADFSGASAFEFTRRAVAFGPRPPGSAANLRLQAYIEAQLKQRQCESSVDPFTAATPNGAVRMANIIARFPGRSGKAIVITGHFDTKSMPGRTFVGANDGGSSTGLLLELARVLSGAPRIDTVYLVWLDGEEAYGQWSATDSLYGSRHLAEKWAKDGTLSRVKALINVDMIGDKDLGILQEMNSSPPLRNLVWKTAQDLGYGKYFLDAGMATEDDHMPFLARGVNALDLIDFDYGPNNAYWHTEKDTLDKLSAHSLEVVGAVVSAVIVRLEK